MRQKIRVAPGARSPSGRAAAVKLLAGIEEVELAATVVSAAAAEPLQYEVILYLLESGELPDAIAAASPVPVLFLYDANRPTFPPGRREERRATSGEDLSLLPQHCSPQELSVALAAVAAGLIVRHPGSSRAASGPRVHPAAPGGNDAPGGDLGSRGGSQLTAREHEVLEMIAEGLPNKTIAAELGITSHTVKFHIASIMQKLGAASRTEAVTIGLRRGIILL